MNTKAREKAIIILLNKFKENNLMINKKMKKLDRLENILIKKEFFFLMAGMIDGTIDLYQSGFGGMVVIKHNSIK